MDQAETFGKGIGPTSRLLYQYSAHLACERIPVPEGVVYDLGGGNGLLRSVFPQVVTVDNNPAMKPDVLADIREWNIPIDAGLIVLRFVLHYLDGEEVRKILRETLGIPTLVIQFTNEDVKEKRAQTQGVELPRSFRTWAETSCLLRRSGGAFQRLVRIDYTVEPEFYLERAGVKGKFPHPESLGIWYRP